MRQSPRNFRALPTKTQQTRDNLRELEPPEDAEEAYDELLAALEQGHRRPARRGRGGEGRGSGRRPSGP